MCSVHLNPKRVFLIHYLQNQVNAKGAFMLEAPITGGLEALKKGQMTVFMAGEKDLAEQVS